METENKPYADVHGDGQGSHSQYSETTRLLQQQQQPNPSQGYPVYPPNMAGMPQPYYVPPPEVGYGGGYGAPNASLSQQPPQVIVVAPAFYNAGSFTGAIVYSCFVFWLWNLPFGLAAFILAMVARDTVPTDPQRARKLARASYIVSSVGVFVTVFVLILVFGLYFNGAFCRGYWVMGGCYLHRSRDSFDDCFDKDGIIDDGYCYYN